LQTGLEIERDECRIRSSEKLHPLNSHSAADNGYANELDLSEWLKLDDWKS
jgi:hypothetical protein